MLMNTQEMFNSFFATTGWALVVTIIPAVTSVTVERVVPRTRVQAPRRLGKVLALALAAARTVEVQPKHCEAKQMCKRNEAQVAAATLLSLVTVFLVSVRRQLGWWKQQRLLELALRFHGGGMRKRCRTAWRRVTALCLPDDFDECPESGQPVSQRCGSNRSHR